MRFRVKFGLAMFSAVAAVLTAVWSDWIELVFRWSPDHGSGSAEWLIVGLAVMTAITSSTLAGLEWRNELGAE